MIKIAITKGRIEKQVSRLLEKIGYDIDPIINKKRELVIQTGDLEIIFGKANDVITFLEQGIVDLGFVGKDTLADSDYNGFYELLDLQIGRCYFALASYPEYKTKTFNRRRRIATKYTKVAREYFISKQEDVEIIKLEGSVELGPIVGISDAIIDLVETGSTLKANGLEVIERIGEISTRLVGNSVSFKFKRSEIMDLVNKLAKEINRDA